MLVINPYLEELPPYTTESSRAISSIPMEDFYFKELVPNFYLYSYNANFTYFCAFFSASDTAFIIPLLEYVAPEIVSTFRDCEPIILSGIFLKASS